MEKTSKTLARVAAMVLVALVMTSYLAWSVSAGAWRTGCFDSGNVARGYTTVTLTNKKQNGYIRIYTYNMNGTKTSGKMHIILRTTSGKWICEFNASSGDKLKLGNNYSAYRVYIARATYPYTAIGNSNDFINTGKCVYWGIDCTTNCYF